MKQVFKGAVMTRTKVVNRIVKTYLLASDADRYDWYMDAHNYARYLAATFKVDITITAGIIAALSPVKLWEQNKKIAFDFIKSGGASGGHMKQFLEKSRLILELAKTESEVLQILKGRKISAFFLNILHPADGARVTIDRHTLGICLGYRVSDKTYSGITKLQYDFFVDCHIVAARKLGVSPLLVQSATWVWWRKNKMDFDKV